MQQRFVINADMKKLLLQLLADSVDGDIEIALTDNYGGVIDFVFEADDLADSVLGDSLFEVLA